jgi:hypothetical protein
MLGHSEVMETCQYNKYWSHLYNKRFVTTAATTIVPSIMRLFFLLTPKRSMTYRYCTLNPILHQFFDFMSPFRNTN